MLEAGNEVDLGSKELRGGAARGAIALLIVLAVSLPVGLAVGASFPTGNSALLVVLLAGSSAAVAFPTIRERGLTGPAIAILITWITLADALTAVLMPLTLSAASRIPLALLGDGLIIAVAAASIMLARRMFRTSLADEVKRESKHRHWALQLRLSVVLLLALVSLGGVLGSLARYGLAVAAPGRATTLAVNVVGSFALGVLVARRPDGRWSRPFLGTGVLGGFTTFSTFAVQTVDASLPTGAGYVAGTLVLGVGAAALGLRTGR